LGCRKLDRHFCPSERDEHAGKKVAKVDVRNNFGTLARVIVLRDASVADFALDDHYERDLMFRSKVFLTRCR
jgi:hypothetical protein